ncbi:MAG: thioether cross-link-forming SCIFF peptide maturase [Oscillospiraceae bacterium]|nr:thioether cross-link-forming SCIFF peptide maturase [Oscillospiraceae bacterium]
MIHKYQLGGFYIVLDVNSGGVHVVDKLTYDLLDYAKPPFENHCPEEILEKLQDNYSIQELQDCYQELKMLYEQKILFSNDEYEKFAKFATPAPVKAMCLHISHDCNLRCQYCFASTGDFGTGRKLMPVEIGKKAIDFLLEKSENREQLELDFFGGEPLMNFDVVKQVVLYAREQEKKYNKHFRFTITTNGMLLNDDNINFINQEMSNVVLSIDGRKCVNDKMRPTPNGKGSYDVILPKFKKLVAQRDKNLDYYVRGTFTKYNLDFSDDVFSLYQAGFDQISVEPVVADKKYDYAITEEDLPAIFAEYEKLAQRLLEQDRTGKHFNFFHFMIDLNAGPCAIKRLKGCGCGNEYVAITPDGDIYPCHQFVGIEEYKMGNLEDNTFDLDMKEKFAQSHIYNKSKCRDCWAKFYCSGGCNANNYQYQGDILQSHELSCELEKKRLECAIMIQVVKILENQPVSESNSTAYKHC